MKKQIRYFCLFALFAFSTSIVQASDVLNQESLSLDQALRIAFAQNPKMIEARKDISASNGRWIQAEALPDPELDLSIGGLKKQTKNEKQVRDGNLDKVAIKQPLDALGTRFLRGRIAHDSVNISKNQLDVVWSQISAQVITVYAQILAFEKALDVARENLQTTRQFLSQVDTRFQSGSARKSEVIRAKIEAARAENDLLVVEKDLKVSKGQMNLALGRLAEDDLSLKDALSYEPLAIQYTNLIEKAVGQRPDVQIEKTLVSSRKKSLWSAILKTFLPQMAIGVERSTQDFENDTSLLISASYPLWGFNLGQVKEAKAEKEKQVVRLEAFKRQVGLEVYQAFLEAELADKQVVLQKKALDEANELLRQVTTQYEEGELAFLNYLENIRTIKETRLAYYNVLKNYQEKIARLERSFQKTPVPEGEK